uniref:myosin-IIIa n=1 Tax=Myxine glutinosa TaxID=7769 RepID=UPI00358F29BB
MECENETAAAWELVETIGKGTYGKVYRARNRQNGTNAAIKILDPINEIDEDIEAEYSILQSLPQHPNVVTFYGIFHKRDSLSREQLWLVLELCDGGSVAELVKRQLALGERMAEPLIAYILHGALHALQHLHSHGVIHRDIKGSNILLSSQGAIKLVDFGVSAQPSGARVQRNTAVGTPFWMAPEVIACEQQPEYSYDNRCDVWSLGITAIELGDGDPPLGHLHPMRALFKIPRNPPPSLRQPELWSHEYNEFISRCLVKDYECRPRAYDLLKDQMVARVNGQEHQLAHQLAELVDLHQHMGSIPRIRYERLHTRHVESQKSFLASSSAPVDDLATLEVLDEETITNELQRRFSEQIIYTYVGDILIAFNPFHLLPIYNTEQSVRYHGAWRKTNSPHIFAIANAAYQTLLSQHSHQCIIVSGESGSGKTESTHWLVQQLTTLGKAENHELPEKILQVNPLLEAFGNASTTINNNSSRFGKFLDLQFTSTGTVAGAQISAYLLEKSRVTRQALGERNFHVFYYMYAGLALQKKLLQFKLPSTYLPRYLDCQGSRSLDVVINHTIFQEQHRTMEHCFHILGFSHEEVCAVYRMLSGVLCLGDVEFIAEPSDVQGDKSNADPLQPALQNTAALLQLQPGDLTEALTSRSVIARGETIVRPNSLQRANDVRDAMAKALYDRLFCWIIWRVNSLLQPLGNSFDKEKNFHISILDIFGFENFRKNSFEQLCINITNEQLQFHFNQHVFTFEQTEYTKEGLFTQPIEFENNQPLLDLLLSRPLGLLSLLDEESRFPQATGGTLVDKFEDNLKSKYFWRPKRLDLSFGIHHFAGKVLYDAMGFLEKNRDTLASEVLLLLSASESPLLAQLFSQPFTTPGNLVHGRSQTIGPNRLLAISSAAHFTQVDTWQQRQHQGDMNGTRSQTVASYFRHSLHNLTSKILVGQPHFVRCVRPNNACRPDCFDREKVRVQLRYAGVLETAKIRSQGHSHRIPFAKFIHRYYLLAFPANDQPLASSESVRTVLEHVGLQGWLVGHTKVFLKYNHVERLDRMLLVMETRLARFQACVRARLAARRFRALRHRREQGAIIVQAAFRGYCARKKIQEEKRKEEEAARCIQKGATPQ